MHPEVCKIGPFTVYSYGLMLAAAFLISTYLAMRFAKAQNIKADTIFNMSFAALVSGVVGARIFYVIENLDYYSKNIPEIIMLQKGGLSWFGGLIVAVIYAVVYLKKKKIPIAKTLDLIAPFLALAQAIGRIGCLLNGCCFGRTVIPVQAYSSLVLVIIFVILRFMQDRPHRPGQVFFAYLLLYSIKRFFIEFWRLDNPVVWAHLSLFQIICIPIFFIVLLKSIALTKTKD